MLVSFWGVDWLQFEESLARISVPWLLFVVAATILTLVLKIMRSFLFLRNFEVEVNFVRVAEAFFLGQAVNILLPSRGGELVRLGYLSADRPLVAPQVTAAIVLEKLLDLIAMSSIAFAVSAYLPTDKSAWVRELLLPLSILAGLLLLALVLWGKRIWGQWREKFAHWPHGWAKQGIQLIDRLVESSIWLRKPKHLVPAIFMTTVIWAMMWSTNLILFQGLDLEISYLAGGLVLILVYIGVLPALMPGNVGPFYFFAQLGVTPFGIPAEDAVAFAVLLHAVVTLTPLVACGILMVLSESVRKLLPSLWKSRPLV